MTHDGLESSYHSKHSQLPFQALVQLLFSSSEALKLFHPAFNMATSNSIIYIDCEPPMLIDLTQVPDHEQFKSQAAQQASPPRQSKPSPPRLSIRIPRRPTSPLSPQSFNTLSPSDTESTPRQFAQGFAYDDKLLASLLQSQPSQPQPQPCVFPHQLMLTLESVAQQRRGMEVQRQEPPRLQAGLCHQNLDGVDELLDFPDLDEDYKLDDKEDDDDDDGYLPPLAPLLEPQDCGEEVYDDEEVSEREIDGYEDCYAGFEREIGVEEEGAMEDSEFDALLLDVLSPQASLQDLAASQVGGEEEDEYEPRKRQRLH